jgi:aminoglycoside phosphotransferase (APT) family kinase protein
MTAPILGKLLGSGRDAEVFESGALVVKLYRTTATKRGAFREAGILALVESLGLPVPSVRGVRMFGDRWGLTMTRAQGQSYADAMQQRRDLLPDYIKEMASLALRIHAQPGTYLPSAKASMATNIRGATLPDEARRQTLLAELAAMPEGDRLCHGDFHPFNILGPFGEEVVVDWPNACQGDPAADVCRSYVLIASIMPEVASAYVDVYAAVSGVSRDRILRWLPFVATARLMESASPEEAGLLKMAGFVSR